MSGQVRRSLALALAGLLAGLGLVLAVFGGGGRLQRLTGLPEATPPAIATRPGTAPAQPGEPAPGPGATPGDRAAGASAAARPEAAAPGTARPGTTEPRVANPDIARRDAAKPTAARSGGAAGSQAPSFGTVRVEPNGEAVVAGQGEPDAVVEMLVDGKPVAKALADPGGQFVILPPPLPAGSSEITLRVTGADGRESRSRQSVAVAVAPGRDAAPLIALTAPDAPTVVLSQPGTPRPAARAGSPLPPSAAGPAGEAPRTAGPGPSRPARIVSVDAQDGGRLFVTGEAPPGSQVRLYLNDTLIAPAKVGADGRVTFTIGRGVKPGRYQVRIDRVDPATGRVAGRAEVPFAMPETLARAPAGESTRQAAAAPGQPGGHHSATPVTPRTAAGEGAAPRPGSQAAAGPARAEAARPAPAGRGIAAATQGPPARPVPDRPDPTRPAAVAAVPPPADGEPARGAVFVPEITTAKITRGDNLWQISKRTYGRGGRYTVIYDANQDQIRDPDLIYPGQIFVLPSNRPG